MCTRFINVRNVKTLFYSSSDSVSYSHSDSSSSSELSSFLTKPTLLTFAAGTGGETGGGGGRNEGGGGSLMLADTDTQLELGSAAVSPRRRTIGLISSRLGISLVAITGSGFDKGFSGLLSLTGLVALAGTPASSSSLISHSTPM